MRTMQSVNIIKRDRVGVTTSTRTQITCVQMTPNCLSQTLRVNDGEAAKSYMFGTQTNIIDLQHRTTALKRLKELKNAAFYLFG